MMTISEFAMATGLNAKTLRFYDEREILPPAEVDPHNGYRLYRASQLRDATTIRVLRAAGMPLDQVAQVLAEPDRFGGILDQHRAQLAADRSLQDRAIALAASHLPEFESAATPQTRTVGPTHWAAVPYRVDLNAIEDDGTPHNDEADALFGRLFNALTEAGNPPIGTFWTTMPTEIGTDSAQLWLTWPVASPVPSGFQAGAVAVRSGTLPARTEAFIEVTAPEIEADMLEDLPGGRLADPHFIAFSEYLEGLGVSPGELRQTTRGEGKSDWRVEYAATISLD